MRRSTAIALSFLAPLTGSSARGADATSDRQPLTSIQSLDPNQVTVSGMYSSGFFAH